MISIVVVMIYNFFGAVWTAIIVGILGALYLYNRWESNYFTSRGIKSIPSRIPFLGNMFKVFIQKEHISDVTRRLYTTFPDEKYVGIRQFNKPIVLIKDLELIKQIGIKDFDFFQDHIQTIDETLDPLFGSNLVALRGQKWRDMRSTLSPAFTSSKMKGMFQFVAECGDEMTQYFKEQLDKPENQNKEYLEIDLKDIFTRYTNDVIATSAFGIKVNSLKERDNTFYTMGKEATNFTGKALIKFFFMIIFPGIMKAMSVEIWDIILVVIGVVTALYLYGKREDTYFKKKGIKSLPNAFPLVGHMMKILIRKEHFKDLIHRSYNAFPEERYNGVRQVLNPMIMVTDLELMKQVCIKDFDHFTDHVGAIPEGADPLFGNNLFSMKGQKWRDMRSTLSPAFTSAKMRGMFDFVARCGEQMADYYMEQASKPENKEKGVIEIEMKDAFTRYTNDVIATAAFGLEVNSLTERENRFFTMGKKTTDLGGLVLLKFFAFTSIPRIMKFFRITLFSPETCDFFRTLVSDTMNAREENNILRPDMIQLLMEAKKGSLKHEEAVVEHSNDAGFATVEESAVGKTVVKRKWTDDEITAQAVLFFFAGFDTSSTLLCFMAHELALNPAIQRKLQEEIDEVAASSQKTITYNHLQNMKYLDMVVSEALRYWPPAVATDRKCVKTYTLPPPNKNSTKSVTLNPGEGIWIPVYAVHHDPKYFKDPEKFDPERFSDENKNDILPFSFIPFGIGPRNCIGSRFALMEAKAVVFHLLRKFDFVKTPQTQDPIKLRMDTFNMHSERGFWVGLKPRILNK